MKELRNIKDPFTRRAFVAGAAKSILGIGAMPLLANMASAANANGLRSEPGCQSQIGDLPVHERRDEPSGYV